MFQLQFVIGLFIGLQFNILHKVLNAPINIENESKVDFYAADSRSFDKPDREADAYDESEFDNIFINPDEMDPYFEGDILTPKDLTFQKGRPLVPTWPRAVIPVEISPDFTESQKKKIYSAMREVNTKTCLSIKNRTVHKDYVYITNEGSHCSAPYGFIGGRHNLYLPPPCFVKLGVIVHEFLHAAGLGHETGREDRATYVDMTWKNTNNPREFGQSSTVIKSLPYDYASVMHFSRFAFAIDKTKDVLTPLFNTTDALLMGQRVGLSLGDRKRVHLKYCKNTPVKIITTTTTTTTTTEKPIKVDNNTNVHFALKGKTLQLEFNFNLNETSFQFASENISLDLKYNASDFNNE